MSTPEQYDAIVIGTGEAGKFIAWHLGSKGQRVVAIEKDEIGGACPNVACLPTKNVVHNAKVASFFQRGAEFGIVYDAWHVNMAEVSARRQKMIDGLREVHLSNFKKSGAEIIKGFGRFLDANTVQVDLNAGGARTLTAPKIFIDTGSRATIDPIPGLAEAQPLTHIQALELDTLPGHLLIAGGGYVGLEFAQAMRRFGSRVTVVERNPRLLHLEDPDISEALHQLFRDEDIDIVTDATITRVEGISGATVKVHIAQPTSETIIEGTHLLVATGRSPNTQNMGLDLAGVQTTPSGHIRVNDRLETTVPGIWAMGDCAGSPHFTHISFDDFRTVRDNLAQPDPSAPNRSTTGRQVPSCMFTDPELAHVGLSETEARHKGVPYRLVKIPMLSVLRTRTLSETRGFIKSLVAEDDRILGFTAFGTGAGELLPAVQLAMTHNLPYTALRDLIIAHPTLSEALVVLYSAVPPN